MKEFSTNRATLDSQWCDSMSVLHMLLHCPKLSDGCPRSIGKHSELRDLEIGNPVPSLNRFVP